MFVASDSGNLYGLSNDGSIVWKYMGVPNDWEQIGGPAKNIYAGSSDFFDLYILSPAQRNLMAFPSDVDITSIQYPAPPETVAVGELVPIVVGIEYDNLAQSMDLHLSLSFTFPGLPTYSRTSGATRVSGSGTYLFSPIKLPALPEKTYPPENRPYTSWPEYTNEWHLKAEIWNFDNWKSDTGKLLASKDFTMLVLNLEKMPE